MTIAGFCAKIFEHINYGGASHEIKETNHYDLPKNWNNKMSSAKVSDGCTLKLYKYYKKNTLLNTIVGNDSGPG